MELSVHVIYNAMDLIHKISLILKSDHSDKSHVCLKCGCTFMYILFPN
jgi:hypothetical protein